MSVRRALTRVYASADPRSLGVFRIALGALLFEDVARRIPDLDAHYSNAGWLPNHFALFRPMSSHLFSLYHAFSTPDEVRVLFGLHLLVNLLLLIGWRTRLMHVFAAVLITSLNSRNIALENGGWVVLNLLTVWTLALPLGRRFSVDAWRRIERARDAPGSVLADAGPNAPIASLAVTALLMQWAVIYAFNVVQKDGLPWRDGSAVYYFLHQNRMLTGLGVWARDHLSLSGSRVLSFGTLGIETVICLLLLVPFGTRFLRMAAWALACALHLTLTALVALGPFSWAMTCMFVALIPREAWQGLERRLDGRPGTVSRFVVAHLRGEEPLLREPAQAVLALRRTGHGVLQACVLAMMAATASQVLTENRAVPAWLKPNARPDWMEALVVYPRLFQGWSMFAPAPPSSDQRLVVDGRTADGRRLDPLTGSAPDFEVQPDGAPRMNQMWGEFHRRLGEPRFESYLPGVRDMLVHWHEISGRTADRMVTFDVWVVSEAIPPPGAAKRPAGKRKLLSWSSR